MPLTKSTPTGEVIKDFIKSNNPKFEGKTKERLKMAIAASYKLHGESIDTLIGQITTKHADVFLTLESILSDKIITRLAEIKHRVMECALVGSTTPLSTSGEEDTAKIKKNLKASKEKVKIDSKEEPVNESIDESINYQTTHGITIHPKNKNDISSHDVNGNSIVRYSVDGGRKKSIQVPSSMSRSHSHGAANELHDEHPIVKLVKSHVMGESITESFEVHIQHQGKGAYKPSGIIETDPNHPTIKAHYNKQSQTTGNKYKFVRSVA